MPLNEALPGPADLRRLSAIALSDGGLTIDPQKADFFHQRVARRLKKRGVASYGAYLDLVESPEGAAERRQLLETLTTHTTSFFREAHHYDFLKTEGFAELVTQGAGRAWPLTIWSAACSSGVELYSGLIAAKEFMDATGQLLRLEGTGTDISHKILKKAENAVYSSEEIEGLNEERRRRFLLRARSGAPRFRITKELRSLSRWAPLNLTERSPAGPQKADVIFLRNVLIYFDKETQQRVTQTLARRLRPGGFLMVGHSESLTAPPPGLVSIGSSIYRLTEEA